MEGRIRVEDEEQKENIPPFLRLRTRNTREGILNAAKQCVCTDRENQYGQPESNFGLIAGFWNNYLRAVMKKPDMKDVLGPDDVAAMMMLLKIARIATGEPKEDNWIDAAGYAACGGEIQRREARG